MVFFQVKKEADMPIDNVAQQFELSVQATNPITGHDAIQKEIQKRWPGKNVTIVSEGLQGQNFVSVVGVQTNETNAVPSSNEDTAPGGASASDADDGLKQPDIVIVFQGDTKGFGSIGAPPKPGKPVIVVTRGDSMDHRIMDSKWNATLSGNARIWTPELAWKYRTNTVALYNTETKSMVIEQGDTAVACDDVSGDIRTDVANCLN